VLELIVLNKIVGTILNTNCA